MKKSYDVQVSSLCGFIHCLCRAAFSPVLVKVSDNVQVSLGTRGVHCIGCTSFYPVLVPELDDIDVSIASCTIHSLCGACLLARKYVGRPG
ncbi:TPA: hypothetical protein N0F65_006035 [Lagenidium giganteum]|uniref:Uncharacterized protein n=1 Tax=Lagenidium giganteum TaxID=4803 RepID=A0AAV2Z8Z1_9STRA|nr:TPA: hypothetical protein N0F65_006035 [Lagenidium giganteum]